ncbi:hypothetical protein ACWIYZ_06755 [Ursidibacter arcticus]
MSKKIKIAKNGDYWLKTAYCFRKKISGGILEEFCKEATAYFSI